MAATRSCYSRRKDRFLRWLRVAPKSLPPRVTRENSSASEDRRLRKAATNRRYGMRSWWHHGEESGGGEPGRSSCKRAAETSRGRIQPGAIGAPPTATPADRRSPALKRDSFSGVLSCAPPVGLVQRSPDLKT